MGNPQETKQTANTVQTTGFFWVNGAMQLQSEKATANEILCLESRTGFKDKYIRYGQPYGVNRFNFVGNCNGVIGKGSKRSAGRKSCRFRRGVVRNHSRKIPKETAYSYRAYKGGRLHILVKGNRDGIA